MFAILLPLIELVGPVWARSALYQVEVTNILPANIIII